MKIRRIIRVIRKLLDFQMSMSQQDLCASRLFVYFLNYNEDDSNENLTRKTVNKSIFAVAF